MSVLSGPPGLPDRYRLDGLIATGGMAAVYAAHDTALDRPVAVKVLAEHLTENPDAARRFEREARAAAALSNHPAVVTIYDVGEHEGRSFIVMERRMRETMADALHSGRIDHERALRWLTDIAEALDAAHERGIVHRDIKPGNLLFDDHDRVAIADFGIASLASEADKVTRTGEVLGTGAYLAPEQAAGEPAVPASDRYALAVVAYELLTGEQPFHRQNFAAQIRAHAEEPPPAAPGLPPAAQDVLKQGMAKRPEERWETSRRFVAALKAGLDGEIEQTAVHDTATTRMMEDNAPRAAVAAAGAAGGARGAVATPPPQPATPPPSPVERIAAGRAPGGAGAPPRERTPRDSGPAGPPPDRSSRRALAALAALLVVLGVGIALAATNGGDDEPTTKANRDKPAKARDKKPDNTPTAAPAAAEEETAAPATEEAETPAPTATPAEEEEAPVSGDPAALNDEGFQLLQSGDAAGAVTPLQGAVDSCGDSDALDPCGYAYYNLGLALTQAGRASEAIPVLQARLDRWGYDRPQEVKKALKDACKAAGQKC